MHGAYIGALETRLGWSQWCNSEDAQRIFTDKNIIKFKGYANWAAWSPLAMARHVLLHGDTYFMDRRFCNLVDHARFSIPGDMQYEPTWLLSPDGWLWMDEPARVPDLMVADKNVTPGYTTVRAVGWRNVPPGTSIVISDERQGIAPEGTTHFLFFIALHDYRTVAFGGQPPVGSSAATARGGFGVWSYFTLKPGDSVDERILDFETHMREKDPSGQYVDKTDRQMNLYHEIRWLFSACKLMSQRLTSRIRVNTSRHVRRRALRENLVVPSYIDIITLRRIHHDAIRSGENKTKEVIDWSCQWLVRGHWRQQWYPAEGVHKPKFIESYVKGPEDKPLKTPAVTLFAARR